MTGKVSYAKASDGSYWIFKVGGKRVTFTKNEWTNKVKTAVQKQLGILSKIKSLDSKKKLATSFTMNKLPLPKKGYEILIDGLALARLKGELTPYFKKVNQSLSILWSNLCPIFRAREKDKSKVRQTTGQTWPPSNNKKVS